MLRALLFFSLIVVGCGGDDDESGADAAPNGTDAAVAETDAATPDAGAPDASAGVAGNTVAGRVTYSGGESGDLVIGLYQSLPPTGPPLAFTRVTSVSFPAEFELTDVDAGTYQAMVVFDVGANNPTIPGAEDLMVSTEAFEITDEVGRWLDVDIVAE